MEEQIPIEEMTPHASVPPFTQEVSRAGMAYEVKQWGLGAVEARSEFSILIHGENRVAHNLLALLAGSGFTQIRLISANKFLPRRVEEADVNGLSVTSENIGEPRTETLMRMSGSAPIPHGGPHLIISTSLSHGDYRQRWMSDSTPHLYLDTEEPGLFWLGPLVLPGIYPCLNCSELHSRDRNEGGRKVSDLESPLSTHFRRSTFRHIGRNHLGRQELPVAAAALAAATAASEVCHYVATGSSSLFRSRTPISLLAPISGADRRSFQSPALHHSRNSGHQNQNQSTVAEIEEIPPYPMRQSFDFHPECGCAGDQLSS